MLKTVGYDIVFQEIPDEVSLAINISNCPNKCPGCHSPYLQEDIGDLLTNDLLRKWIDNYKNAITCVVFMGGDGDTNTLYELAAFARQNYPSLKLAWYSGNRKLYTTCLEYFDFVKIGPYKKAFGNLRSKSTNQRLYKIKDGQLKDITSKFWH